MGAHWRTLGGDRADTPRPDIRDRADILALLAAFYARAFDDPLLGPVFRDVAHMDLGAHLPVITDFWDSVLFRSGRYHGNALAAHRRLHSLTPLTGELFARWLAIWTQSVDERHAGPYAERAKRHATRIAEAMTRRLNGAPAGSVTRTVFVLAATVTAGCRG